MCATRPVVCKLRVSMTSLCSTAAPNCNTGQSKGRYQTRAFNPTHSHSPNPLKKSLPRVSIKFEKFRLSMHGAVVLRRCNYIPKKLYGLDTSSLMMHWTIFFVRWFYSKFMFQKVMVSFYIPHSFFPK